MIKRSLILIIALIVFSNGVNAAYYESYIFDTDTIFESNKSAMLLIDSSTGAILDANKIALEYYGYSKSELLSMNINEINTLTQEQIDIEMQAALNEKRNYFEFKHRLKDGTIKDVEVYSSPASLKEGNTVLISIIHDNTEKKLAQLEASSSKIRAIHLLAVVVAILLIAIYIINRAKDNERRHKNKFKHLFDNMHEGFALHEIVLNKEGIPVDYKFLDVNSAFERITGLQLSKIKNKTVKEVIPEIEQFWIDTYGQVALNGKATTFTQYTNELDKYFRINAYSTGSNQFVTIFTDITFERKAQEQIENDRKLLELILEDTLSGYWDWDLINNTEYLSPSFKAMFGYTDDELENVPEAWQRIIFKEDLPLVLEQFEKHVKSKGEVPFYNELRYHHKNGSIVWVICSGRVIEWIKDKPVRMVGCHINITKIKDLEKTVIEESNLFKTTLHSIGDGVISTDKNGNINIMNAVAERLTGWDSFEAKGRAFQSVFNIVNEHTRKACENPVEKVLETKKIIELENHSMLIKKNKEEVPVEDSAAPIRDEEGNISGVVVVFRDCTDKKEKQDKIRYLSYHDQLTGLYNRHYFEEELNRLDTNRNLPISIIMADVNGLKLTNDAFGHIMGDILLKKVAEVLKNECRADDIISRVGGDEFVVLLPKTGYDEADLIVKRIYRAIQKQQIDNVIVSVSIGLKTKEQPSQDVKDIYAKAEDAMYRKKITESQSMRHQSVKLIMQTLYEANPNEKRHSERVSKLSRAIGQIMKLDEETLNELEVTGLMHDIGKIAIDNRLLNKQGKFTEAEYDEVKRHPEISYQILKSVDIYTRLAECVLSHHERWDGRGYPRELSGENIPLTARIITVADAYEAMTADRPYKKALSRDEAKEELIRNAGTQFDPDAVTACLAFLSLQK